MKKRIESDSLGSIEVPSDHYWGAQTERSLIHFSIGKDIMPNELVHAFAIIKAACAMANHECGKLSKDKKDLIVKITEEILTDKLDAEFPVHVWMTGSGTQFNMNVNEVIANRASEITKNPLGTKKPLHPNDDINMSQSSNDTFPTAMHIATIRSLKTKLFPSLTKIMKELDKKSKKWKNIIKIGRTHMQDAVPLSLGQEFSGYHYVIKKSFERIQAAIGDVLEIPIGGTAVGTGLNTPPKFDKIVVNYINTLTQEKFKVTPNKFALQGSHDALVAIMSQLKILAVSLFKISNDIRLLSCGPRVGFHELMLPQNEPGSSIMPGKINPTQCEAMCMVCAHIMGLDTAVSVAGSGGYLEMNVYKPLIIFNILTSITLLSDSINNFTNFLLIGIKPNEKKINQFLEESLMLVTALSPIIGYDKASQIAHYAFNNDCSLKEANKKLNILTEEKFNLFCDPKKMI